MSEDGCCGKQCCTWRSAGSCSWSPGSGALRGRDAERHHGALGPRGHRGQRGRVPLERETIALSDNLRKNGWASCDVVPDSGERRDIRSPREDATVSYRQYQPWFSGTATVTCDEQVTIRSGATLTMYRLALSPLVRFGSAAIAAIPLVLALIWYYGLVRIRN
ncbi:hypothetical protein CDG81_20560 [Actinopolyspora erythraea]|uniref:Uncharacterized protein n=1 Tax=Actinopolyspora erythraea TaxID=414996 RepID=A0A223RWM4_9ACTN|nr:hypothetical protein [Actinopolyspora erythraea]ASU80268.1 hypothetical protein CDG81_20560 [Actinopolyspora erythraea]